jgi:hypothetical protein
MGIFDRAKRFFASDDDGGTASDVAPMVPAVKLGGYFMAHAVWSVSEGEALVPILGTEKGGERKLTRLASDTLEEAVARGHDMLRTNPDGAARAVLIYDVFLTLGRSRTDALMMEVVDYGLAAKPMKVAIPYRAAASEGGFAVHRPKFMTATELEPQALRTLGEAFFAGVHAHEQGSAVWASRLDERR